MRGDRYVIRRCNLRLRTYGWLCCAIHTIKRGIDQYQDYYQQALYGDTIKMLHPNHPELKEEITINKYHKELMRMKHRNLNMDDIAYIQEMDF